MTVHAEHRITLVLLTYNCGDAIDETLARLLPLGVPLVVVDNGSTDQTVERLCGFQQSNVEVLALPRNVGAVARNEGLKRARTPYVFLR